VDAGLLALISRSWVRDWNLGVSALAGSELEAGPQT